MFQTSTFYKFFDIKKSQLKIYKQNLTKEADNLKVNGIALISPEGLNSTFCGSNQDMEIFKTKVEQLFKQTFFWKNSYNKKQSFKRLSVKIKTEIINIGVPCEAIPHKSNYLNPQEWEKKLQINSQVLDVRNTYETQLGYFKKAEDLNLENFQEFPQKLANTTLNKEKETLIYCTGGIRCEKAIEIMKNQGFQKVYQLKGGILNYLKEFPNSYFKKDCFVFDHRVALNQKLEVTESYCLCPHCGQPGNLNIICKHCKKPSVICQDCNNQSSYCNTCSKNCAYHFKKGHTCRKKHTLY